MEEGKWASGRWQVKEGSVDEFIRRWGEWLGSVSQEFPGFRMAKLLRAVGDPLRFTSFAEWDDDASLEAWKTSRSFRESIEPLKAMCDDFLGGNYDVVAAAYAPANQPS